MPYPCPTHVVTLLHNPVPKEAGQQLTSSFHPPCVFSYGSAKFVSMDTEEPYSPGSPQYNFIEAELAAADRTVTPWLFLVLHRPILSADSDEVGAL